MTNNATRQLSGEKSELIFRAVSDMAPLGILVTDAQGKRVYSNSAFQRISGIPDADDGVDAWSEALHPNDRPQALEGGRSVSPKSPFQAELRFLHRDGKVVWTRAGAVALADGLPGGYIWTFEDVSELKAAQLLANRLEAALREEQRQATNTLDCICDAVIIVDAEEKITTVNVAAERLTGWSRQEALGRPLTQVFQLIDGFTRQSLRNPVDVALRENRTVDALRNATLISRNGFERGVEDWAAPIYDRDGNVSGAVLVFRDVSYARGMAMQMAYLAQHDPLTGLPNRGLLGDRLAQAIVLARRHFRKVALLYVDLDHFKSINDSMGHLVGDKLLQSVSERLQSCVRISDTVSRQGGDEFVVLLAEIEQAHDAALAAEKMITAFALPHHLNGSQVYVTLSIGISIFPDDGTDAEAMMRNADIAMYHAKQSGRNNYRFFTPDMNERVIQRQIIETDLRRALEAQEFVLYYQPKVNLESGAITGAEVLLRWRQPTGVMMPALFVQVAEDCGLILQIGRWVMREACRQARRWIEAGLNVSPISINISTVELHARDFLDAVRETLEETGLAPEHLELELSESALMHDTEASSAVIRRLKAMGVRVAIDAFGTGSSSLSCLKRFPVDTLKIDRSFVRDMIVDEDDAAIVSAVIGMGKCLRHRVVAAGIETEEQLATLRSLSCDDGQGFHFSHPLPADAFAEFLARDEKRLACN